ncbi:OTU deubiquitinase with linear linkage specificity a [Eucyclogobius newberryi]|uniref:OTU deubiquitinase with linear linkage specificity a n=1 Tax=Eucyclogobius newberryi TaxID=166745 RepID=UPI003B5C4F1D
MSWHKSVSLSGEDVFDENADELDLPSREWSSNMKKRARDGYVDGVDDGEEASLQPGFNQGFKEGAARTVAVSRLKGFVTAISCWCESQHPENPAKQTVSDLLRQVTQHEETILEDIKRTMEKPQPSVSDISEAMEDLGAVAAGGGCCGEQCKETDCCKGGEEMQTDVPKQPRRCPDSSSDSLENKLLVLIQRCTQLVTELGLPLELTAYVESLANKDIQRNFL